MDNFNNNITSVDDHSAVDNFYSGGVGAYVNIIPDRKYIKKVKRRDLGDYKYSSGKVSDYEDMYNELYSGENAQTAQYYLNMAESPFSYDVYGSALYNQYKDQFTKQAELASEDAMGRAAALTGGYGNSYAQSVATQAYNNQMNGLNDIAMQLYQMAYNQHQDARAANLQMAEYYNALDAEEKQNAIAQLALLFGSNNDGETDPDDMVVSLEGLEYIEDQLKSAKTNKEISQILNKYYGAYQITGDQKMALLKLYSKDESDYYDSKTDTYNLYNMAAHPELWTAGYNGGANLWGIDKDATVTTPLGGEAITLEALKNQMVDQGTPEGDATQAIKQLQKDLGLSDNWWELFGIK